MEAGVVVGFEGEPVYWHVPSNRTAASLPDSRDLWDVIWKNRTTIQGFAHSHPGQGVPGPSWEDITTFAGVELALGRRLVWWITSEDTLVTILWAGPGRYDYVVYPLSIPNPHPPIWLEKLRLHSSDNFVARFLSTASPEQLAVLDELGELDRQMKGP